MGQKILLLASVVLMFVAAGCVERQLTINTEPQGGLVFLNDEEIGIAPITIGFSWYGNYSVRVTKDDYQTLNTNRILKAPLHDKFPIDFFAEIVWPGKIVNSYDWTFKLEEYKIADRETLLKQAEELKELTKYELK